MPLRAALVVAVVVAWFVTVHYIASTHRDLDRPRGCVMPVDLMVRCDGCGRCKTFTAPDARALDRAMAESRWVIGRSRVECPSCYLEVQRSYESVVRGRAS